eukprot:9280969-Pyramimonas_sp.AAC.1
MKVINDMYVAVRFFKVGGRCARIVATVQVYLQENNRERVIRNRAPSAQQVAQARICAEAPVAFLIDTWKGD